LPRFRPERWRTQGAQCFAPSKYCCDAAQFGAAAGQSLASEHKMSGTGPPHWKKQPLKSPVVAPQQCMPPAQSLAPAQK